MKSGSILILQLLIIFLCEAAGAFDSEKARIDISDRFPVEKKRALIAVRDALGNEIAGAEVTVTYRPGSKVEETLHLGKTNAAGIAEWFPKEAGIVRITAKWREEGGGQSEATRNVSVKFASVPGGGVLIMILAGLLLIGGSIRRFTQLLRSHY